RKDDFGKTLTTELSAEGETQLADIAKVTGGAIVRAEKGDTGIDEVARSLKKMMREELAEHVEIAFDEEYAWPLGLAIVLLVLEGLIPEAPLPRLVVGGGLMPAFIRAPTRGGGAGGKDPSKKGTRKKKKDSSKAPKKPSLRRLRSTNE